MLSKLSKNQYLNDVVSQIYDSYLKSNAEITFDINSAIKIIDNASELLRAQPSVLELDSETDFIIVGDIHGSLESLINIFLKYGSPLTTKYLFLGDYVDRGEKSIEVIILLYAFKILYPENVHLIRGNHEFRDMNDHYGFKEECYRRIVTISNGKVIHNGKKFYDKVTYSFQYLPLCAILNDKIFCVHGGISALINNRNELFAVQKVGTQFSPDDSVAAEFLWNDPDINVSTYKKSPRGIGCLFGNVALVDFLKKLDFEQVIRGHQNEMEGCNWTFGEDGGILTVFSAVDYCGLSNDGAVCIATFNEKRIDIAVESVQIGMFIFLPEKIIETNFAFLDDVTISPDLALDEMACLI